MGEKYSKKELMDKLRDKYITPAEREKFKNSLIDRGYKESKAGSFTSGQQSMKKAIADEFSYKSERERDKILKKMGFRPEKRKEFKEKIEGRKVSQAELKKQEKIERRKKRRNVAAGKAMSDQLENNRQGGRAGKEASLSKALTKEGAKVGHTALGIKGRSYSTSIKEGKKYSQSDYYDKQGHKIHQTSAGQTSGSRGVAGGFGMVSGKGGKEAGGSSAAGGMPIGFNRK